MILAHPDPPQPFGCTPSTSRTLVSWCVIHGQTELDIFENHELKESDSPMWLMDRLPHWDHLSWSVPNLSLRLSRRLRGGRARPPHAFSL